MSRLRSLLAAALVVSALVPLACGPARRGEPLRGPLELTSDKEQRGQQVFLARCQKCHPGGEAGLGPALNDKPVPGFVKQFQVRHGLGAMPSFSDGDISSDDLDALTAYLAALRKR